MNLDAHTAPQADPRPNTHGTKAPQQGPAAARPGTSSAATPQSATSGKVSLDPLHATDRYRLVMPWADRV